MATKIIQKMGAGEPAPESLDIAELAVDVVNGNLYTKLSTGDVVLVGGSSGNGDCFGVNIEGGNASSIYLPDQAIDGGSASSIYLAQQNIDGGSA